MVRIRFVHVVVFGGWAPSLVLFRLPLLTALVGRGHQVTAMAADSTPEVRATLAAHGINLIDVPLARAGLDPLADTRTLLRLVGLLRELRPDVLLSYTIKPVIYGTLAARFAHVPRRYAMITGLGYAFQGQGLRRRGVRLIASSLYRVALAAADALFVQNEDDPADLRAAGALPPWLPITRLRGSGVDLAHYTVQPLADGPTRYLFVGRLLREKGVLAFVELARAVRAVRRDLVFEIVGGFDPNPSSVTPADIQGWVAEGLIEYAGEVTDVRPHLARCHVLILPSDREGTPRSVLEAMSTGRPVIVSNTPGCRDTIVDGEHGFVVQHGDIAALRDAALVLADDRERIERMGAAGRARVSALYDAHAIAAQMIDVMGL
ncbi:MAG: glycosyltransferase family 4 protein [Kofleriaceae bacterium]